MVQHFHPTVPLNRSHHLLPYSLREPSDHGIMVMHVLDRPMIMVPQYEDRRPQSIQEPDPALDIVEVIIRGIGVRRVHERTRSKTREIVSIPEVDDLIRREGVPEEQHRGQCIGVGAIPVGTAYRHDPFAPSNSEHGEFQAQTFGFCKRP